MTIAEIESTLYTLFARHNDLNEETLKTLLLAGGWENVHIQEALSIFKTIKPKLLQTLQVKENQVVAPVENISKNTINPAVDESSNFVVHEKESVKVVADTTQSIPEKEKIEEKGISENVQVSTTKEYTQTENIVYFDSSGEEERDVSGVPNIDSNPVFIKEDLEIKKDTENVPYQEIVQQETPVIVVTDKNDDNKTSVNNLNEEKQKNTEPQSLIEHKEDTRVISKEVEPPMNLPLKPFESSPHVWPFSKYKDVFHGETMPEIKEQEKKITGNTSSESVQEKNTIRISGFDREDESLIVLTGVALLVIILLLVYMYSNGRL